MKDRRSVRTFVCQECRLPVTMLTGNHAVYCSAECRSISRNRARPKFVVRYLAPGEAIPEGQPLRYGTPNGYVRLRWANGDGTFTEVAEHRVFDGRNSTAEHVHHINHIRDDNRRENLMELTADEHRKIHNQPAYEQYQEWRAMYELGHTTTEIAEAFGTHAGNVYRGITSAGATIRKAADYARPVPQEEVVRRYTAGEGATSIAKGLGISYDRIQRTIKANGIPRRPAGRVPEMSKG